MLSASEISSLRGFDSHDRHPVVSLYLNLDSSTYPSRADYETELSSLISKCRKAASEELGLNRDQLGSLDSDLRAIGEFISLEYRRNGARGLVIFACASEGLWQVDPLKVPVANRIYVDWKPQVAPLVETLSGYEQICVLVTSKETARIFQVRAGEISEQPEILDRVLKRHNQGGWEQAKFQRKHELQVRNHLKKATEASLKYFRKEHFDRLMVGVADELWPELERVLHPYLLERMAGRFNVNINASPEEILAKVTTIEEEQKQNAETTLMDSLGPELGSGRTFVGGLDDVLAALNQRRVDLLLVESSFAQPGKYCQDCQTLEFTEETCPACGSRTRIVNDVVAEARELAIRQDARIMSIEAGNPAIVDAGHIAARLRY
ncbi:MAG: baeRF10 domain-containing protein [Thermoleophilia bacterium]